MSSMYPQRSYHFFLIKDKCLRVVRDSYGVRCWKNFRNGCETIKSRSHFMVGNGRRVKFLKDGVKK